MSSELFGRALRALGHRVEPIGPWTSGGAVQPVARNSEPAPIVAWAK